MWMTGDATGCIVLVVSAEERGRARTSTTGRSLVLCRKMHDLIRPGGDRRPLHMGT